RLRPRLRSLRSRRRHGRPRAAARPARPRAVHPRPGRRADARDGRGADAHRRAPDVLRAPSRREGHGRVCVVSARRGAARERGLPLDAEPHACRRRRARALSPSHRRGRRMTEAAAMSTQTLSELAKTIRSKNAGVNKITFDIIFRDRANYERVKRARVLTRESVAALYRIPLARICDFVEYDPAYAIKFTIYRLSPSGSAGDGDIFGAQQYAPLLD